MTELRWAVDQVTGWIGVAPLPAYSPTAVVIGSAIIVLIGLGVLAALVVLWWRRR